jgi:hypothetical protein
MAKYIPYRLQYRKKLSGNLKKIRRKKIFSLKSMTKLEDLTVSGQILNLKLKGHGSPDRLDFLVTFTLHGSGSWSDFESQKVEFLHEKYTKRYKSLFDRQKTRFICVNFSQLSCSWTRIRILNTNPDPRQQN